MVVDRGKKIFIICDIACAWEPLVAEREKEKRRKYQELAADLAGQWGGYRVKVVAVVVGTLGLICDLEGSVGKMEVFSGSETVALAANLQREALCGSIQIIKRHFAIKDY